MISRTDCGVLPRLCSRILPASLTLVDFMVITVLPHSDVSLIDDLRNGWPAFGIIPSGEEILEPAAATS
jgi:hypothetical protein